MYVGNGEARLPPEPSCNIISMEVCWGSLHMAAGNNNAKAEEWKSVPFFERDESRIFHNLIYRDSGSLGIFASKRGAHH